MERLVPEVSPKDSFATDVPSIVTVKVPPSLVEPQEEQYWDATFDLNTYSIPLTR